MRTMTPITLVLCGIAALGCSGCVDIVQDSAFNAAGTVLEDLFVSLITGVVTLPG